MVVMKFGGTSVADAAAIRRLVAIVRSEPDPRRFVVVSALAGVTDRLLELARIAGAGDTAGARNLLVALRARHDEAAGVVDDPATRARLLATLAPLWQALDERVGALAALGEVTPRSLDATAAVGELASSRIVAAALGEAGLDGLWLDPRQVIVTDDRHTAATPRLVETRARLTDLVAGLQDEPAVLVMGGFVGASDEGVTTTLGRGGSDCSASIVGAALGASEILIWTDVDGMLTGDPRVVRDARPVPRLTPAEAAELAYFGAKVLHPATIAPAVAAGIPVRIRNARRPEAPGSLITDEATRADAPLAAIACKRGVTLVDVTSTRMLMACGFLRRLFEVFERFETPVDVVTTSEVSVTVTIDDRSCLASIVEAISTFAEVRCDEAAAIVCIVGEGLRADPRLPGRVLAALDGLTVKAVSQAASRRNLTVVLSDADVPDAVARLHHRFFETATVAPAAAEVPA